MRYAISLLFLLSFTFLFAQQAPQSTAEPFGNQRYAQDYIDNVGGKLSVGIALGDGFGVPVRYYVTPKDVVEAGFYVGATAILREENNDEFEFYFPSGPMFGIAYSRLGEKFEKVKRRKSKIRALGVTPRVQYQFPLGSDNTFSQFRLSLGFTQETYKGPTHRRNYVFEIGPYYRLLNGNYEGVDFTGSDYGIYLRFNWNWFLE